MVTFADLEQVISTFQFEKTCLMLIIKLNNAQNFFKFNPLIADVPFIQKPVNRWYSKSVDWFLYDGNICC